MPRPVHYASYGKRGLAFDVCPRCGGTPLSLGIWATQLELECQCCGLIYRNREHELAICMNRVRDKKLSDASRC